MPHVYLVQPVELVGTHRYKIGMTSLANLNRIRSYKNGTRYLCILEKSNALEVERKLKSAFNQKYNLIGGKEYFEINSDIDSEEQMIDLFISTAMGYNITRDPICDEPKSEEYTLMDSPNYSTDEEPVEYSSEAETYLSISSDSSAEETSRIASTLSIDWLKKFGHRRKRLGKLF